MGVCSQVNKNHVCNEFTPFVTLNQSFLASYVQHVAYSALDVTCQVICRSMHAHTCAFFVHASLEIMLLRQVACSFDATKMNFVSSVRELPCTTQRRHDALVPHLFHHNDSHWVIMAHLSPPATSLSLRCNGTEVIITNWTVSIVIERGQTSCSTLWCRRAKRRSELLCSKKISLLEFEGVVG